MNFIPLFSASLAIQLHVLTVIPAAVIGAFILLRHKGTPLHRFLGRIWVVLMVIAAISSFFIHQLNLLWGFSPIHILSGLVLLGCWRAVSAVRAANIETHRLILKNIYIGGILGAGFFAFMPGRIMNEVVFPQGWRSLVQIAPFGAAAFFIGIVLMCGNWIVRKRH
ncbi:DUF2306 domain-containing protein [Brucella rhizosphaerae]|uniref:DUF2306 domain-containing protein n=1 Tax=Brucella rhizosphaerae TaxID=571254 RepID=A0A256FD75_9HYPH|nr:DUF2306 domain-containing protein [Brucella rhizosphaerae]OYR12819.1 hypothetical protein CEV32_0994 [Brucella rhizosphaerae]